MNLCKNLFGWPKGLPSFTSSTLKTKKQPVNLQDDLRSTCFDWCLAPKPPQKKTCTDLRSYLIETESVLNKNLMYLCILLIDHRHIPICSSLTSNCLNNRRFFHDKRGCAQALRHKFWKLYRLSENIKCIYHFCQCKSYSATGSWVLYSLGDIFQWPGPRQLGTRYILWAVGSQMFSCCIPRWQG